MKRSLLAFVTLLLISGCHRNSSVPTTSNSDPVVEAAATDTNAAPAFTPMTGSQIPASDISLLEQINRENIRVINAALPSIVRISVTVAVDPRQELNGTLTHIPMPYERRNASNFSEVAYGAGVVIKKDGYIVTNSHVVVEGQSIEVQLQDHRVFPATIVAADTGIDVAVLKIAATDLKPLPWGDSDKVRVGEQVFAIGNPFDLGDSASRGIISATGRTIPEPSAAYQDYLQTDAAINPGNSGGALINIRGELIGINVEIASTTGADRGVGFALPSNLLRFAIGSLLEHRRVTHAYLGVEYPNGVDEGVIAQLGLGSGEGALLSGILPNSPAARAKLQTADFITSIDGHKIGSIPESQIIAAQLTVGRETPITYIRDGQPHNTFIKVDSAQNTPRHKTAPIINVASEMSPPVMPLSGATNVLSGLQISNLNDKLRLMYQLDDWVTGGVLVTGVQRGSAAEARGLQQGDVIEMVCVRRASPQSLDDAAQLSEIVSSLQPDQGVALLVHRAQTAGATAPTTRFLYLPPLK